MEFRVKTALNNVKVDVFSKFIDKKDIKINKEFFAEMCKKCRNYNKKYSCPPKSPDFNLLCNKSGLFIVLLKINLSQISSSEYNKVQIANSMLKSRIDKIMRVLEKKLCAKYIGSGSCRLCKPCNMQKNLPCRHPKEMRFSLESIGIDCDFLSKKLFNIPLLWFKNNQAPKYTCVLAGLICDEKDLHSAELELNNTLIKDFINP
jgi:predicted metal-binding protein